MSFCVFYRQGSFALVDTCRTYDEAVAHAQVVQLRRGVWHVRIEDAEGRRLCSGYDLPPPSESLKAIGREAAAVNRFVTVGSDAYGDDGELSLPRSDRERRRAAPARQALRG